MHNIRITHFDEILIENNGTCTVDRKSKQLTSGHQSKTVVLIGNDLG